MKAVWRILKIVVAIALCVVAGVFLNQSQRNRAYDMTRNYALNSIQLRIDMPTGGESRRADEVVVHEQTLQGDVYILETAADLVQAKAILAKSKPLYDVYEYEPVEEIVIVGGVNIGFAGGNQYFLPTMNDDGTVLGFTLTEEQNEALWALLETVPVASFLQ